MSDALLAGATGLVGHEFAAQWAAQRPGAGTLHLLVRKPVPAAARQKVLRVDYGSLPVLPASEEACCCLGTTIKAAGSQAAFRAVDYKAVLAFARAAQAAGVRHMAVVSALGASPRASSFYNRVKGEMESTLIAMRFEHLVIARPSLLTGDRAALGQSERSGERLAQRLSGPLSGLIPRAWRPIAAATVARALLHALAQGGRGVQVLESKDLQDLGRA
jgi:uncharacterized protein YbjT (DUF2867 family)